MSEHEQKPARTRSTRRVRIPSAMKPTLEMVGRLAARRGARAYAVGGCVRDWLLGCCVPADLDVAVEGDAIAMARAATAVLDGRLTIHRQFGTATLTREADGRRLDFATCRTETYAKPAAYPRVAPGTIEEDLFRRDFTINAMAVALEPARLGGLVDPFHGAEDLREKRLRILHARSFRDDPSRMLRGIRFRHRFGLRWEPATKRALEAAMAAGALGWLNRGRLEKELTQMQREPNPGACFRELAAWLDRDGPGGRR